MRICLAAVLICDLLIRMTVLSDYHSDSGFVPRAELQRWNYVNSALCFHLFSGETWAMACLFVIHIAALLALMLGFHTQKMTALCWFLGNSLQTRNPYILDSGDRLYLLILLWGFFCHWGAYYSLDSKKKPPVRSHLVFNVASAAMILQMCSLYWLSVYYKTDPAWRGEGTALYIALNLELFCRPWSLHLLPYENILKLSTHFTIFAELASPLFILSGQRFLRLLGVVLLVVLHAGIFVLMSIGIFPLVSLCYLLCFVPSFVWDRLLPNSPHSEADSKEAFELRGQSWSLQAAPYKMTLKDYVAGFLLALTFLWNGTRAAYGDDTGHYGPAFYLCHTLKIDQYWNLFSPMPRTLDCWFIVQAATKSGKQLNLWEEEAQPIDWEKSKHVSDTFRNHRDRVWATGLENVAGERIQLHYLRVKAQRYNESHPEDPIYYLRFYRMEQLTAMSYRYVKPEAAMLFELAIPLSAEEPEK